MFSVNITSSKYAGGLIGRLYEVSPEIRCCYTCVNFVTEDKEYNGGFIGYAAYSKFPIECSYSIVAHSSSTNKNIGGFVGRLYDSALYNYDSASNFGKSIAQISSYSNKSENIKMNCNNNELTDHLKNSGSEYTSNWNFGKTWTWNGKVDGVSKSVVCPRLSWE